MKPWSALMSGTKVSRALRDIYERKSNREPVYIGELAEHLNATTDAIRPPLYGLIQLGLVCRRSGGFIPEERPDAP